MTTDSQTSFADFSESFQPEGRRRGTFVRLALVRYLL